MTCANCPPSASADKLNAYTVGGALAGGVFNTSVGALAMGATAAISSRASGPITTVAPSASA